MKVSGFPIVQPSKYFDHKEARARRIRRRWMALARWEVVAEL